MSRRFRIVASRPGRFRRASLIYSPFPKIFPFELALTKPIDTAVAAEGDVVTARLEKSIQRPRSLDEIADTTLRESLAGAIFTGRILVMEHHLGRHGRGAYYLISIVSEVNGASRLCMSDWISPGRASGRWW